MYYMDSFWLLITDYLVGGGSWNNMKNLSFEVGSAEDEVILHFQIHYFEKSIFCEIPKKLIIKIPTFKKKNLKYQSFTMK